MELLIPAGVKALTATCTQPRQEIRASVTTIQMTNSQDTAMLCTYKWPSLVMIVVSTTVTLDEHHSGDHVKSHVSDTTVTLDENPLATMPSQICQTRDGRPLCAYVLNRFQMIPQFGRQLAGKV